MITSYRLFNFHQTIAATHMENKELAESIQKLLIVMQRLDQKIAPLLESDGELFNTRFCICLLRVESVFQNLKRWLFIIVSGGVFSREQAYGTKAT